MFRYMGVLGAVCLLVAGHASAQVIAIKAGRLLDPQTALVTTHQIILIDGAIIKAVGARVEIPPDARVIDLSDAVVLPGLFDCHTHLCLSLTGKRDRGDADYNALVYSTAYRALQGAANARAMLESGFTTVRDVGNSANFADTDLRHAIEEGLVPGPTIINSGPIIAPFGGQVQLQPERRGLGEPEYRYADTRDEMLKAIRENIHFGAKVIKIVVDDQPFIYSPDDIAFIVAEAGRAGRKVCAHCVTRAGAHNAVVGGVASVEHGWNIADEDLALAKQKGIVLVNASGSSLVRAYKAGVTLAYGTDAFGMAGQDETRGTIAIRFVDVFTRAAIPTQETLRALTTNAARLLGVEKERGTVRVGFHADIIAVPMNPLDDIAVLKHVSFVMKDGNVVKSVKPAR